MTLSRQEHMYVYEYLAPMRLFLFTSICDYVFISSGEIAQTHITIGIKVTSSVTKIMKGLSKEIVIKFSYWMIIIFTTIIEKTLGQNEIPSFYTDQLNDSERLTLQNYFKQMLSYMDQSINPCDDFYKYACGNWNKFHPVPQDKTHVDVFSNLQDQVDEKIKNLLEEASQRSKQQYGNYDDAIYKAGLFYSSCMNENQMSSDEQQDFLNFLGENGYWPALYPDWQEEEFDWLRTVAKASTYDVDVLIRVSVSEDFEDSTKNRIFIIEPSVGMYRENFIVESKSHILDAYRNMIAQVLQTLGTDEINSKKFADEIVEFEIEIAKIISDPNDSNSILDIYHLMTIQELQIKHPLINWADFLFIATGMNVATSSKIILLEKNYFEPFFKLIAKTKPKTIQNYVVWRIVQTFMKIIDSRFNDILNNFNNIAVGKKEPLPRWVTCVKDVSSKMEMVISALYVRKHFDEYSRYEVKDLFERLRIIFEEILQSSDWMDEQTKNYAIKKLKAMEIEIGYPDTIQSDYYLNQRYKMLNVSENYFRNTINANKFEFDRKIEMLNKIVRKKDWDQSPVTVNSVYDVTKQRVFVNAAILQLPAYSKIFPKALLFGGFGVFLGHEITHGFDETGRLFGSDGNQKNWWSDESEKIFQEKGKCLEDQYGNYTFKGYQINGIISKSENIADNGGVRESYYAYLDWLKTNNGIDEKLYTEDMKDMLRVTNKQLFFLQFAQMWCENFKPEGIEDFLQSDIHAPGEIRVLGSLSNFNEFSNEFGCPVGTKMNPLHKCGVW